MFLGLKFKSHYSVTPVEYEVVGEVDGAWLVKAKDGSTRTMDARILKAIQRSEASK